MNLSLLFCLASPDSRDSIQMELYLYCLCLRIQFKLCQNIISLRQELSFVMLFSLMQQSLVSTFQMSRAETNRKFQPLLSFIHSLYSVQCVYYTLQCCIQCIMYSLHTTNTSFMNTLHSVDFHSTILYFTSRATPYY